MPTLTRPLALTLAALLLAFAPPASADVCPAMPDEAPTPDSGSLLGIALHQTCQADEADAPGTLARPVVEATRNVAAVTLYHTEQLATSAHTFTCNGLVLPLDEEVLGTGAAGLAC